MTARKSRRRDEVGRCHSIGTDVSDEMPFRVKRSHCLGSQDVRMQEDFIEINTMEKSLCIKCNQNGKLLVCSDRGCPIAVHEKCMNSSTPFDDTTNFYCPYCSYRRALEESCQARQKATLAKKALSIFLDKETTNSNMQKEKTSIKANRQDISPSTVAGNNDFDKQSVDVGEDQELASVPRCSERKLSRDRADEHLGNNVYEVSEKIRADNARLSDSGKETIDPSETSELVKKLQVEDQGKIDDIGNEKVLIHGEVDFSTKETLENGEGVEEEEIQTDRNKVGKKLQTEDQGEIDESVHEKVHKDGEINISNKEKLENGEAVEKEEDVQPVLDIPLNTDVEASVSVCRENLFSKHTEDTDKDRVPILNDDSPLRIYAKANSKLTSNEQNEKNITKNTAIKFGMSSRKRTTTPIPDERRKPLPWSDEEEEKLKEGVHKFSKGTNKNLPWRKVLEFGQHVFDLTRTPVDLKEKWRRYTAKESSRSLDISIFWQRYGEHILLYGVDGNKEEWRIS